MHLKACSGVKGKIHLLVRRKIVSYTQQLYFHEQFGTRYETTMFAECLKKPTYLIIIKQHPTKPFHISVSLERNQNYVQQGSTLIAVCWPLTCRNNTLASRKLEKLAILACNWLDYFQQKTHNMRPSRVFFPNRQMCFWWTSIICNRVMPSHYCLKIFGWIRGFLLGRYKLLYIGLRFCNRIPGNWYIFLRNRSHNAAHMLECVSPKMERNKTGVKFGR